MRTQPSIKKTLSLFVIVVIVASIAFFALSYIHPENTFSVPPRKDSIKDTTNIDSLKQVLFYKIITK